ncbi:MAG: response regulator [bacterium]|nr:response regulator [bacterium]
MDNQKKKIVIIDDELSFLNIFSTALEKAGFEVKGFSNSKEALMKVIEEKPDLILLDITMPEMNGFEVFGHLKKDFQQNMPKIVFLTNLGETVARDSIDEQYAKNIGAQGYIRKTDDLDKIVQKIKELLG